MARFNVTCTNRWFGIRCYDSTKQIGFTDHMPSTLAEAEKLVESMGATPKKGSPNSYYDFPGWYIECVPAPGHSIDDCWCEIVEDFFD